MAKRFFRVSAEVERNSSFRRQVFTKLMLTVYAVSIMCIAFVPICFVFNHNYSKLLELDPLNLTSVNRFWKVNQQWGIQKGPMLTGLRDLIADFDVACRRCNIIYMLHQNAALGAFRHHGVIPWDHSVSVLLQKMPIRSLQHCFIETLLVVERKSVDDHSSARWIIHRNAYVDVMHPKDLDNQHIPWPYLEVYMYEVRKGVVVDIDQKSFRFPLNYVLPPAFYPFEDFLLPSYRCLSSIINVIYDSEVCCLSEAFLALEGRSNFIDGDETKSCVKCSVLTPYFRFVIRRHNVGPSIVIEEVRTPHDLKTSLRYFHRPVCPALIERKQNLERSSRHFSQ